MISDLAFGFENISNLWEVLVKFKIRIPTSFWILFDLR